MHYAASQADPTKPEVNPPIYPPPSNDFRARFQRSLAAPLFESAPPPTMPADIDSTLHSVEDETADNSPDGEEDAEDDS
jgi:hypothetical protein